MLTWSGIEQQPKNGSTANLHNLKVWSCLWQQKENKKKKQTRNNSSDWSLRQVANQLRENIRELPHQRTHIETRSKQKSINHRVNCTVVRKLYVLFTIRTQPESHLLDRQRRRNPFEKLFFFYSPNVDKQLNLTEKAQQKVCWCAIDCRWSGVNHNRKILNCKVNIPSDFVGEARQRNWKLFVNEINAKCLCRRGQKVNKKIPQTFSIKVQRKSASVLAAGWDWGTILRLSLPANDLRFAYSFVDVVVGALIFF